MVCLALELVGPWVVLGFSVSMEAFDVSPTFGEDGRVIGVFSGSIIPGGKGNLDELNYFYPIDYLFSFFTR